MSKATIKTAKGDMSVEFFDAEGTTTGLLDAKTLEPAAP
jgi:hypothetical protein